MLKEQVKACGKWYDLLEIGKTHVTILVLESDSGLSISRSFGPLVIDKKDVKEFRLN